MSKRNSLIVFSIFIFLFCLSLLFAIKAQSVQAMTADELEAAISELNQKIVQLQAQIDEYQAQISELNQKIAQLQNQIDEYQAQISEYQRQLEQLSSSITVISPNGGEEWEIGKTYTIRWESQGVEKINIFANSYPASYGVTGNSEKIYITRRIDASLKEFNWRIGEDFYQAGYRWKVYIEDFSNPDIMDGSDEYFDIVKPITCTDSDQGKDYYTKGTLTVGDLSYTDYCLDNSRLIEYYCSDNQMAFETYTCPYGCENGVCKKVQPKITVISPNGGEEWEIGKTYTIKWRSANIGNYIAINLIDYTPGSRYGTQYAIRQGTTPYEGSEFAWTIPSTIPPGSYYKVYVGDATPNVPSSGLTDASDNYFSIISSQQEDPVTGTLSVDKTTAQTGENITLTISAQDDQGVYKVRAYYQGSWHTQYCNNQTSCTKTWTFTEDTAGTRYYYGYVYGRKLSGSLEGKYTTPTYVVVFWNKEITCTDSDGGRNYYRQGVVEVNGTRLTDFCIDSKTLKEHYCSGSDARYVDYACPYGCENGACLSQPPQQEDPVQATLSVDKTQANVGENITLTISAQDDQGVYKVMAYYQGSWHTQYCNNQTECTKTWTFTETSSGSKYYYGYVYGRKVSGSLERKYASPTYVIVRWTQSAQPAGNVDLVVRDIYYDYPYIRVKYCNVGQGTSANKFLIKLRNEDTGKEYLGNPYYPFSVPAAGKCEVTGGYTPGLIGLSYGQRATVSATIDWENKVKESNEHNNVFTKIISSSQSSKKGSLEELSSMIASMQEAIKRLMESLRKIQR